MALKGVRGGAFVVVCSPNPRNAPRPNLPPPQHLKLVAVSKVAKLRIRVYWSCDTPTTRRFGLGEVAGLVDGGEGGGGGWEGREGTFSQ